MIFLCVWLGIGLITLLGSIVVPMKQNGFRKAIDQLINNGLVFTTLEFGVMITSGPFGLGMSLFFYLEERKTHEE